MNEREARVEIACRLFQAGKLDLWPAAELAGLSRAEMEGQLRARKIPIYSPTIEDFDQDVKAIDEFRREGKRAS
jgi:predicted HTH domain antitoxin